MKIRPVTHYEIDLDPAEMDALTEMLEELPGDRGRIREVIDALTSGDTLTYGQADDLRVWTIRYLKRNYPGQDWPEPLDSIGAQLQAAI